MLSTTQIIKENIAEEIEDVDWVIIGEKLLAI